MSNEIDEKKEHGSGKGERIEKSEEEWKQELNPEAYHVLREKGTELPHTGKFNHNARDGTYLCGGCGNELFSSETKFESGSGWPSFWEPIERDSIETEVDRSMYMRRTEVKCQRCGGHLGHVFNDGPKPTGLRYCLNSAALSFTEWK